MRRGVWVKGRKWGSAFSSSQAFLLKHTYLFPLCSLVIPRELVLAEGWRVKCWGVLGCCWVWWMGMASCPGVGQDTQEMFGTGVWSPCLGQSKTKPWALCRAWELFPPHVVSTIVMILLLEAWFIWRVSTQQDVQSFIWKKIPVLLGWAKCLFRAASCVGTVVNA